VPYHLAGVISFDTSQAMNRARRAVERWISDWNSAHPANEDFTLVRMDEVTVVDEDDNGNPTGLTLPALDFEYTSPSQASMETAHSALHADTVANQYNDILGLSIWLD
jgi:hypothetical protein